MSDNDPEKLSKTYTEFPMPNGVTAEQFMETLRKTPIVWGPTYIVFEHGKLIERHEPFDGADDSFTAEAR